MLSEIKMKKQKNAQSLMLSYVILISIVIAISIGVFAWLKSAANIDPIINCDEGTSIILTNVNCSSLGIELELKNNGRFSVGGFILTVSNDSELTNPTYLVPLSRNNEGLDTGSYLFEHKLEPGNKDIARYSFYEKKFRNDSKIRVDFNEIKTIQIQPFIFDSTKIVLCQDALIKQNIQNCNVPALLP